MTPPLSSSVVFSNFKLYHFRILSHFLTVVFTSGGSIPGAQGGKGGGVGGGGGGGVLSGFGLLALPAFLHSLLLFTQKMRNPPVTHSEGQYGRWKLLVMGSCQK